MRSVHFVGSVVFDGPEDVFEAIGRQCGPMLKRVPGGEPAGPGLLPLKLAAGAQRSKIQVGELGDSRGREPGFAFDFIKTCAEAARS